MTAAVRHDWTIREIGELFDRPLLDLVRDAEAVHREFHDPAVVHVNQLLSIKTGACPEDCGYCSQSVHNDTGVKPEPLMQVDDVVRTAKRAQANGVTRFCMGAAWRDVKDNAQFDRVRRDRAPGQRARHGNVRHARDAERGPGEAARGGRTLRLQPQPRHVARVLRRKSSRLARTKIGSTRLPRLRETSITVCCGGIIGMGESTDDRISFLHQLATLDPHPDSVPINVLSRVPGTPLENAPDVNADETVRMIAGAHPDARIGRSDRGRPSFDELLGPSALLPGGRELDLYERAQHHAHRDHSVRRPRVGPSDARGDGPQGAGVGADRCLIVSPNG